MLLRSLFPQILYNLDGGGAPAPADTGTAPAAPVETPAEPRHDEPKVEEVPPDLDEELSSLYDKLNTDEPAVQRDERGRFVNPNKPKAEAEGNEDPGQPTGDDPGQPDDQQADPNGLTDLPQSWPKDKEQIWASLSPEAREFVAQRELETRQVLSRVGNDLNTLRQYQPVIEAVAPFQEYLGAVAQHVGTEPATLVGQVLRFENLLRTGSPDQKRQVLASIIQDYQIDLTPMFGEGSTDALSRGVAYDPRVETLQQQLQEVTKTLTTYQQREEAQINEAIASEIQAMASNTKDFPYFAQAKPHMAQYLRAGLAKDMKDAYEQVIWAVPQLRQQVQKDQREAAARRQQQEDLAKRQRAAASTNVRSGVPGTPKRSLDDELSAKYDEVARR